jgi:GTP-binding protein EngB required for normal cell division
VSAPLDRRLTALAEAVELADGRLDPDRVDAARAVVARAGRRLGLGVEETVVALAGPTGAGKSSLFNAVAGDELVTAGRRRPTTATASAAVWGDGAGPLLDWLEVPRRHQVASDGLHGLVLLDLPDFDSVEAAHRLEVDRVLELADLVVWIVDPQKYADASLHEQYLRPLAGYRDTMLVVLNQADLLDADALAACRADIGRLLREDGLDGVPVLAASAIRRDGLGALREALGRKVAAREAAVARLGADVERAAAGLAASCGDGRGGDRGGRALRRGADGIARADRTRLVAALEEAAGVPAVVSAVERAHRRRGALATGWPFVRWARRLRPDPLRRLHLAGRPDAAQRTSLPGATGVQRAEVAAAARAVAARASDGLPDPWPGLVRAAATRSEPELPDHLDRAVAGTALPARSPAWWRAFGLLQIALAAVAAVGALWLVALAGLGYLQLQDAVPHPKLEGFPLPTVLLLGSLLAGLLVAALTRWANGIGARRRGRRAARALRRSVEEVAETGILEPVRAELEARDALCGALAAARA